MFKPKPTHPKWYLWLYPYLIMLRYEPKYFFRFITGRALRPGWHYEWEDINAESEFDSLNEVFYLWLDKRDGEKS